MITHYLISRGMKPDEVAYYLKGWEIIPIMDDDVKVGEAMVKECEIHVAFGEAFRGKGLFKKRAKVNAFFQKLLDERGFLVTRSFKGDSTESFIRRLGFKLTHSDRQFNFWWLDTKE